MMKTESACRSCGGTRLEYVLFMGRMPLADRLLTDKMLSDPEPLYPLTVVFCPACSLVQIAETVSPEELFCRDYPYYSSFSDALLRHSRENALGLMRRLSLGSESLVVELASNDGYMLRNFVERSIPVLGIDPAEGPARAARKAGVPTLEAFFGVDLARQLRDEGRAADLIIANNVLAHVADLNGFVAGIRTLLKDTGTAVLEVPYVRELIENCEFDTIYHEHLCYFSVTALDRLFRRHGLFLNELDRLSIHGGSLRLYVSPVEQVQDSVQTHLTDEEQDGLTQFAYYQDFAQQVSQIRHCLLEMLWSLKQDGKRIAAYGAAAKGAMLINYMGIGPDLVDFVVDRNTHKQGCHMPGQHLPVRPCEDLIEQMPDYVLMLAWNFAQEIIQQQHDYLRRGGAFIVPVPMPHVVRAELSALAN